MTNNFISLYFHIPFCVKKCDYCAFYSLAGQSEDLKQEYFEALKRQVSFFETEKTVRTVYFGGGTPPILGIDRLCELIETVRSRFKLAENCEITVEVNPKTVDFEALLKLRQVGANRLSVGIQSSSDRVLKSLGRIHTFEDAKICIADARKAGFYNISGDIIFALPNQSGTEFRKSVSDIVGTGVDHISAYSLQIEEGTPLFNKRDELVFPDEDREEAQYEFLYEFLKGNGFSHYEISSFSKSGFESKHNLNYWECGEYFGFGAGAHSFFGGKRFSAVADVNEFIKRSYTSLFAPTDFEQVDFLTPEEEAEERIMLGLRTARGAEIPEDAYEYAKKVADLGYGVFEDGVLRLNSKGFRVSNSIISEILI